MSALEQLCASQSEKRPGSFQDVYQFSENSDDERHASIAERLIQLYVGPLEDLGTALNMMRDLLLGEVQAMHYSKRFSIPR